MWERYGRTHTGVAIRSTIARLIGALAASPPDVFLSAVSYVDYDKVVIPTANALYPIVHKRLSYSSEMELRALTVIPSPPNEGQYDLRNNPPGIYVPVDLAMLVEAVYVAPTAPTWLAETVGRAVRSAIRVDVPIRQSRLGEAPLF